jgi:trehalose 6-phosphate phosphatase
MSLAAASDAADDWALLLDFDGTLVEIAARPDGVIVPAELVDVLRRIETRLGGALALVSGRTMADIDYFLKPHRFDIAALHGAERRVDDRVCHVSHQENERLRPVVKELASALAGKDGVVIEDKGATVAVHWRLAPSLEATVMALVDKALHDLGPGFRLQMGKSVAEIAPQAADKGRAIEALLADPPYRGRRPVFIGDDLTDEEGFAAVGRLGGIAVRVGPDRGIAQYRVADPEAVRTCLKSWAAGVPIDPARDFHV